MTAFSRRVLAAKPSASLAVAARAIQLRREGKEIVSLSVGEPDFPVFPHVARAFNLTDQLLQDPGLDAELRLRVIARYAWIAINVGRYAPAEKSGHAQLGAVVELVGDEEIHRSQLFFERADRAD